MLKQVLRSLIAAALVVLTAPAIAAGGGADLAPSNIDPGNIKSLQRGAANFMNYCSGCHSAQYVRYSTIGENLELSDELAVEVVPRRDGRKTERKYAHTNPLQEPERASHDAGSSNARWAS